MQGCKLADKYMSHDSETCILNLSSILGLDPLASIPVYTGTKHAVIGYTRSLGARGDSKRRYIALCPGVTTTKLISEAHHLAEPLHGPNLRIQLDSLPPQSVQEAARAAVEAIRKGDNGSVWIIEAGQPACYLDLPVRIGKRDFTTDNNNK